MVDLREQLQSGLADRYRVERELGRGGMALTPRWLEIDPPFDPIRKHPRCWTLVEGTT